MDLKDNYIFSIFTPGVACLKKLKFYSFYDNRLGCGVLLFYPEKIPFVNWAIHGRS